jgi:HD-like signal output (HDOD) protein
LILAVGMRSLFLDVSPAHRQRCELLWRHSFVTACLCRQLCRALELGYHGEEFSCGLAHDLGRILIAVGVPTHFPSVDPMEFVEGPDLLAHEQEILGTDHCELGAWFANVNQLPASLSTVMQLHHTPGEAAEHAPLVGLVATADHMANYVQREQPAQAYDVGTNPGWSFLSASLAQETRAKLESMAGAILEAAVNEAQEVVRASTG